MNFIKLFIVVALFAMTGCSKQEKSMEEVIDYSFSHAIQQYKRMGEAMMGKENMLPRTIDKDGNLVTAKSKWWTSGFFPGALWYIYEYTGDKDILDMATDYTARVEKQKYTTTNHDVGFMLYCSFGNGLRITGEEAYNEVLMTGSKSLSTRFDERIGCIKSWNTSKKWRPEWHYPVIIDNMMNLELLMWASKHSGNKEFEKIAKTHADNTLKNQFRNDNSCYHVVSYDTINGGIQRKDTHQGYSKESSWARGQAWALYGYTMMFRETKEQRYLDQAVNVAEFILNHPNLPEDKIPYWDFDAPDIPNTSRDASSGAIIASALIELSRYVDDDKAEKYIKASEVQLRSLASADYMANIGENGNFILKHNVGSFPKNSEVDVPLTYADYYFLEALLRYKKLIIEKA